jgi:twitching motility protein PilT
VGLFDHEEEKLIRVRLSDTLRWVVSQRLLPKVGGGRVAALEIMGSTLLIKDIITNGEEQERSFYNSIASLTSLGWQTFDQHILDLYRKKIITEDVALTYSSKKSIKSRGIYTIKAETGESIYAVQGLALESDYLPPEQAANLDPNQQSYQQHPQQQHPPQLQPPQLQQQPQQQAQQQAGQRMGGVKLHS